MHVIALNLLTGVMHIPYWCLTTKSYCFLLHTSYLLKFKLTMFKDLAHIKTKPTGHNAHLLDIANACTN